MRVRAVTKKPEPGPTGLLKTRRGPLIGAAAAVVVIAIAAAITATQIGGKSGNKPSTAAGPTSTQQPSQSSAAPGAASCPFSVKGAVTTGNGPGDQNSGVGTIMAFEHAYYVTRSAKAARAVALPDAVAKEPDMQYFIDRRPPGTTYCLTITDRGRGAYSLQMTESPPGQPQTVYHQAIQTVESGHKHWIQSIKDQ